MMLYLQPQQPAPEFDFAQLQTIVEQRKMQQQESNPLASFLTGMAKAAVVGGALWLTFSAAESLFGSEQKARDLARLQRARNRRLNGPRVKIKMEKAGNCTCCLRRSRYTEIHHYKGRAVPKGREMCAPCHLHCGHNSDWKNAAINPRDCWL